VTGSPLRWGLLSTASIGETVVRANRGSEVAEFVAVASRDADKARSFADRLGLPLGFGSYEELLESEAVDAVYVALYRRMPGAVPMLPRRRASPVFEGLMYRHHPRTELARRLVEKGAIGEVTLVRVR
jgi:xylose dehydrogenase (NAD/NADP)